MALMGMYKTSDYVLSHLGLYNLICGKKNNATGNSLSTLFPAPGLFSLYNVSTGSPQVELWSETGISLTHIPLVAPDPHILYLHILDHKVYIVLHYGS